MHRLPPAGAHRRTPQRILTGAAMLFALVAGVVSPAAASPSAAEQQAIYELNLARWDPITWSARTKISIPSWVMPRPPLAVNDQLSSSARTTAHCTPGPTPHYCNGTNPNKRVRNAGYPLPSGWPDTGNQVESSYGGGTGPLNPLAGWFGSTFTAHVEHTLGQDDFWGAHREVGFGHDGSGRWIVHTAHRESTSQRLFITGVVYRDDTPANGRMDLGEGEQGVKVELLGTTAPETTDFTNAGGGYSLRAPGPGTYTVRASGNGFTTQDVVITVTAHNVGVDFVAGEPRIVRDFAQGTRLAGSDRYGTAVAVSQAYFSQPSQVDRVFVATGTDFPDALAAAAIAGKLGAPLLLTHGSYLPAVTRNEIIRLNPQTIVVVGGTAVVSNAVFTELNGLKPAIRRAGADRYATAVSVSQYGFPGNGSADVVYIATGANFADALTSAPAAAGRNGPVLLTAPNSLPAATRNEILRLAPDQIVILGGTAAVSTAVENQLKSLPGTTIRVSGPNRYATAVAISKHAFPGSSPNVPAVFVTVGTDFPDALAGAAAAAAIGAPVILSPPGWMDSTVALEVTRLGPSPTALIVLGGTSVFSPGLHQSFLNLL